MIRKNLWDTQTASRTMTRPLAHVDHLIVDRVGGGDSFAAGLLYALGHGFKPQDVIEYAAAASCLKHSIELDVNLSTVAEVRQLMAGDGSGRVQR